MKHQVIAVACLDFESNHGDPIEYQVFPDLFPITLKGLQALTDKGIRLIEGDIIVCADNNGETFTVESIMFHCEDNKVSIGYSFKTTLEDIFHMKNLLNKNNLYIEPYGVWGGLFQLEYKK